MDEQNKQTTPEEIAIAGCLMHIVDCIEEVEYNSLFKLFQKRIEEKAFKEILIALMSINYIKIETTTENNLITACIKKETKPWTS